MEDLRLYRSRLCALVPILRRATQDSLIVVIPLETTAPALSGIVRTLNDAVQKASSGRLPLMSSKSVSGQLLEVESLVAAKAFVGIYLWPYS